MESKEVGLTDKNILFASTYLLRLIWTTKWKREKEKEWSALCWLTPPNSQGRTRPEPGSHTCFLVFRVGHRGSSRWVIFQCSPRRVSRRLDWKQSNPVGNQHSNVRSGCTPVAALPSMPKSIPTGIFMASFRCLGGLGLSPCCTLHPNFLLMCTLGHSRQQLSPTRKSQLNSWLLALPGPALANCGYSVSEQEDGRYLCVFLSHSLSDSNLLCLCHSNKED